MESSLKRIYRERVIMDTVKAHHEKCMASDTVYRAAYHSPSDAKNPYTFPQDLDMERMRIALVEGDLTEAQKVRLRELNELMEKTEWSRWSYGYYHRWELELVWA